MVRTSVFKASDHSDERITAKKTKKNRKRAKSKKKNKLKLKKAVDLKKSLEMLVDDGNKVEIEGDDFINISLELPGDTTGEYLKENRTTAKDGEDMDTSNRVMQETMPWMKNKNGYLHSNLYMALHEEILDFVQFISPTKEELQSRNEVVQEVRDMMKTIWSDATVETFGSHETQMFLPQSDIDLVIFGAPEGKASLFTLAGKFEEMNLVSYLEVIDKARIPIVKMIHKATKLHIDISFNISSGLATADLIKHYMQIYPSFRPLTLVLKYYLSQRSLNETFSGGIGSYLLQLIIVSFLQQYRRSLGVFHTDPRYNNMGKLLLEFLNLYARDFNYEDVAISVRYGGSYFLKIKREWLDDNRPYLLSVENPNEPDLDVGKNSYEIRTVRRSFEYARRVLTNELHRRGQFDPLPGSILGTIIPPLGPLLEREGPNSMGFEILYHDTKKADQIRQQYEARCAEQLSNNRASDNSNREGSRVNPAINSALPHLRWRGRTSKYF